MVCDVQGVQLYSQMTSGFSEKKQRFRERMSSLWTAQNKEPEQK